MRLLLIRHGQTTGNIEERIQGDDDPLTDLGRLQARTLAAHLACTERLTHLYASTLDRAMETASIVGSAVNLAPIPTPGLAETNAGTAAGILWEDWRRENVELSTLLAQPDRALTVGWPGGEDGIVFGERVLAAYEDIVARHAGSDDIVAAVSHGGTLGWIAARIFGDALDRWPGHRMGFRNCSISIVEFDRSGAAIPGPWNQTDHLDGLA